MLKDIKKYECTFYGRKNNAIGINYKITEVLTVHGSCDIKMKLYEKYECVRGLEIKEIDNA